ncbi:MAG: HesA/MoeB/ThiF family protein [Actinobacteria bacterium]|nr:HesA/MoeB/ThiF family protein [Actinomycetota bacterium]
MMEMSLEELIAELRKKSFSSRTGSHEFECLSLEAIKDLALIHQTSTARISSIALRNGIIPARYSRNIGTIGAEGQAKLLDSAVVVVGTGGIGGRAAELLARMGVGKITLVDPDVFDQSNLNRQDFSSEGTLGKPKAEVVRDKLADINCDVEAFALLAEGGRDNLREPVESADLVIDALDNIDDRLELEALCKEVGRVMVHGAIAGDYLQATTVFPGDPGLKTFMGTSAGGGKSKGIELETGNPATTPAIAASIQVHEAIGILSGKGARLQGRLLYMDLDDFTVDFILLSEPEK